MSVGFAGNLGSGSFAGSESSTIKFSLSEECKLGNK